MINHIAEALLEVGHGFLIQLRADADSGDTQLRDLSRIQSTGFEIHPHVDHSSQRSDQLLHFLTRDASRTTPDIYSRSARI